MSQIINSAVWAAYGDAIGFITELADDKILQHRLSGAAFGTTTKWRRRIGGRYGASIEMPEGTYSDDTQLRLSTSRCINSSGVFDVEAFAKIEIPVWRSYALGAGIGSKAAADNLAQKTVKWTSNFFNVKDVSSYVNGGGNGAAMRIQPHVWASKNLKDSKSYLTDVIKNSVCTHGHLRGIMGSIFHAKTLAHSISNNKVPSYDETVALVHSMDEVFKIMQSDFELSSLWLVQWEKVTGKELLAEFEKVMVELLDDLKLVKNVSKTSNDLDWYYLIVESLRAFDSDVRGSGTKTAILAWALAERLQERPEDAIRIAANCLGSDTDTIATMAGALVGSVCKIRPSGVVKDEKYIVDEAQRLEGISKGKPVKVQVMYPDLMDFPAIKKPSDYFGQISTDEYAVIGLGRIKTEGPIYKGTGKYEQLWQWAMTEFGQTILVKRSVKPKKIKPSLLPSYGLSEDSKAMHKINEQPKLIDHNILEEVAVIPKLKLEDKTLDELSKIAIAKNFDPDLIGKIVLQLSTKSDGIELVIAFTSIIAKAYKARFDSRNK